MAQQSLHDLYVEQLRDLYSAESQILDALPKMERAAVHSELQNAFRTHRQQTQEHVRRLERIFEQLGENPEGETCQGIKGIIKEGEKDMKAFSDSDVLDAALIADAQRVEHYEMAGYGSVRAFATQLGRDEDRELLQQTLDEEEETDRLLTDLAERTINADAARR
jgi:ferritin-like metal-binding protein YciE